MPEIPGVFGRIVLKDEFSATLKEAGVGFKNLLGAISPTVIGLTGVATAITTIGLGLKRFTEEILQAARDEEVSLTRLGAMVKATGGAAGFTAGQLDEMASGFAKTTRFSDDAARSAETALLKFTNVQGEIYERTLKIAADVAEAGTGSFAGAAQQIGRAMQYPLSAGRVLKQLGIEMTTSERARVKQMVESNQLGEAQNLILKKAEEHYSGVAAAMANTAEGAATRLTNKWHDMYEEAAKNVDMVGAQKEMYEALSRALDSPEIRAGLSYLAGGITLIIRELVLLIDTGRLVATSFSFVKAGAQEAFGAIQIAVGETLELLAKMPGVGLVFGSVLSSLAASAKLSGMQNMREGIKGASETMDEARRAYAQQQLDLIRVGQAWDNIGKRSRGAAEDIRGAAGGITEDTSGVEKAAQELAAAIDKVNAEATKQLTTARAQVAAGHQSAEATRRQKLEQDQYNLATANGLFLHSGEMKAAEEKLEKASEMTAADAAMAEGLKQLDAVQQRNAETERARAGAIGASIVAVRSARREMEEQTAVALRLNALLQSTGGGPMRMFVETGYQEQRKELEAQALAAGKTIEDLLRRSGDTLEAWTRRVKDNLTTQFLTEDANQRAGAGVTQEERQRAEVALLNEELRRHLITLKDWRAEIARVSPELARNRELADALFGAVADGLAQGGERAQYFGQKFREMWAAAEQNSQQQTGQGLMQNFQGGNYAGGMQAIGWAAVVMLWTKVLTGLIKGWTEPGFQWGEAGMAAATLRGSSEKFKAEMSDTIDRLRADMDELTRQYGLGALDFSQTTAVIGRSEFGYYVKLGKDAFAQAFRSLQEALDYYKVQLVKQAIDTSKWASDLMREIVEASRATTPEGLERDMDLARTIDAITLGPTVTEIHSFLQAIEEMRTRIRELVHDSELLTQSLTALSTMESQRWQDLRDAITGQQRTREQEMAYRRQQAAMFNAELALRVADLQMRRIELQQRLEELRIRGQLLGGGGDRPRPDQGHPQENPGGGGGGIGPIPSPTQPGTGPSIADKNLKGLLGIWQAELNAQTIYIKAKAQLAEGELSLYERTIIGIEASIAAIDALLANLPQPIDFDEIKLPRMGGGGAGSPIDDARRAIEELNKAARQFAMGNYARMLDDINEKWKKLMEPLQKPVGLPTKPTRKAGESDEEFKARMDEWERRMKNAARHARENAEELKKLEAARLKEIELLRKQAEQEYSRYLGPQGGTDFGRGITDFLKTLDEIPRSVLPNWEKAIIRQRFLAEQLAEVTDRIAQFMGEGDPLAAFKAMMKTYQDILADIEALQRPSDGGTGISQADADARRAAAAAALAYQQQMMGYGLIEKMLGYLKGNAKYDQMSADFAKMKVKLEFEAMKMQLTALGLWEEWAGVWNDALNAALDAAGGIADNLERGGAAIANAFDNWLDPDALRAKLQEYIDAATGGGGFNAELVSLTSLFWNAVDGFAYQAGAYGIEMDLVNRAWEAALESLRQRVLEPIRQLRDQLNGPQYSDLTAEQQIQQLAAQAQAQYAAAIGGDLNAYALYAQSAQQLLQLSQQGYGGTAGFAYYRNMVDAMTTMLEHAGISGSAVAAQQSADSAWQASVLAAMNGQSRQTDTIATQAHVDATQQRDLLAIVASQLVQTTQANTIASATPRAA